MITLKISDNAELIMIMIRKSENGKSGIGIVGGMLLFYLLLLYSIIFE